LAITISSVIIDDLNVVGIPFDPTEAQPPLVIDSDAMLSPPVTRQCLEAIPRRGLEIAQGARPVKVVQLPARHALDRRKVTDRAVLEESPGVLGCEGSDHGKSI
jgi:hypothetical protein